jgi:hypothetical protein
MSNSREKKPADKKSIQFSCRYTESQQWWKLGTHTQNEHTQELVNNTSSQYTAQTCKTQGLSSLKGKEGMGGGMHSKKNLPEPIGYTTD